jgi:hypothetical protein
MGKGDNEAGHANQNHAKASLLKNVLQEPALGG